MGRRAISLISYNPYTDQRIDPLDADDIYKNKDIPSYIHDAVRRAKDLVGDISIEILNKHVLKVNKYLILGAPFQAAIDRLNDSSRNYCSSNQSDELRDFLEYADHDESEFNKPILFGVLTLSLAGEMINILYPSDEYKKEVGGELELLKDSYLGSDEYKREVVMDLAVEAVRSAGIGEGLLIASRFKQEKSNASDKSRKDKNLLYSLFCEWAISLPENHGFSQTEDAVNLGFKIYLEENDKFSYLVEKIKKTTYLRLKKTRRLLFRK